jgi:signal transduction histidine kinase
VDGIAIISADDRIQYLNRSAAALLGFDDPAGVLGRKWFQFYEDAERDLVGTETLRRRDTGTGTGTAGGARTHEITRARIEDSSHVLIIRDISERIAEKERQDHLRDALARAQRQEAVAQLASGIAHDFNNLLSAISGSATLIDVGPDASPAAREHARRIVQASNRAGRLVNRLLDLGASPRDRSSFELRTALADLPAMVAHALPRGVSLETDMGEESMVLHGDPDALGQICLNLILNANDALPIGGGRVSLKVTSVQPGHAHDLRIGTLSAGRRYACIAVADNGSGIDGEALTRIFEPDYSTKGPRGTGLGLTMSALLTRAAGGGIDVESAPGRGSTFSVYWPITTGAAYRTDGPQPAIADADLSGQTYLVVDDDLEVGQVLQSYLERCGAEVALSDAPDIAADAIAEDTGMWSALITDYDMPGMTGGDLVERVRAHAPDLPVILVTALARRITDPRVRPDRIDAIFPKPLDLAALAGKLAEIARRRQKDSP